AIYVGTLQPRKNLTRLLEAFAIVGQQLEHIHLVIAGKRGWLYKPLFARVQELGLDERVHFAGYVPQDDLPALISGACVFVLPSLYEGFGLPVVEAMACGTPVICSNVSSLPEVTADAAILVNPLDTAQLAEALGQVVADQQLRNTLANRGLLRASQFSWDKCAHETLRVLETVGSMHREHQTAA
ncbi:MAG: glycosyltransferase family 4 protein, partial [Anaerolineales bacterium]